MNSVGMHTSHDQGQLLIDILTWLLPFILLTHPDRSSNKRIGAYQEWLKAPDYVGKSEADIAAHTITSLKEVKQRLMEANM